MIILQHHFPNTIFISIIKLSYALRYLIKSHSIFIPQYFFNFSFHFFIWLLSFQFCPLYAPNDAPIGTIVSFPGYSSKPSDSPSRAAKAWRQLEKEGSFYVDKEGVACFDPRPNTKSGKSIGADKGESEDDMVDGKSLVDSDNSVLGKREKGRSVPFSVYLNDFSVEGTRSKGLICTSAVSGRIL